MNELSSAVRHRSLMPIRRAFDPSRKTIFMHVPKTSGTAFTRALMEAIEPRRTLVGLDGAVFGAFRDFASAGPAVKEIIFVDNRRLPEDTDLVAGHMAISTSLRDFPEAQAVTVLREPLSRLLSLWLFWRCQSDESLSVWGTWARYVTMARDRLEAFLSRPELACQTDNMCIRMLLWPHRLIPDDAFIPEAHDEALLAEAMERLARFAFVDVVENPGLAANMQGWLGRPFVLNRVNETPRIPDGLRSPLDKELTAVALDRLETLSRLDAVLWKAAAGGQPSGTVPKPRRSRTLLLNGARFAALMAD